MGQIALQRINLFLVSSLSSDTTTKEWMAPTELLVVEMLCMTSDHAAYLSVESRKLCSWMCYGHVVMLHNISGKHASISKQVFMSCSATLLIKAWRHFGQIKPFAQGQGVVTMAIWSGRPGEMGCTGREWGMTSSSSGRGAAQGPVDNRPLILPNPKSVSVGLRATEQPSRSTRHPLAEAAEPAKSNN